MWDVILYVFNSYIMEGIVENSYLQFGVESLLVEGATMEGNHSFGAVTLPLLYVVM